MLNELYSEGYSEEYLFPGFDGVKKSAYHVYHKDYDNDEPCKGCKSGDVISVALFENHTDYGGQYAYACNFQNYINAHTSPISLGVPPQEGQTT